MYLDYDSYHSLKAPQVGQLLLIPLVSSCDSSRVPEQLPSFPSSLLSLKQGSSLASRQPLSVF